MPIERNAEHSSGDTARESSDSERDSGGEHAGNESEGSNEHGGSESGNSEDGEESAEQFTKTQTYDRLRAGSRLILTYDAAANAFTGSVQNISDAPLTRIRVEIHLSNGTELGPTTPLDLAPGASAPITLAATAAPFQTWSAHAEIGGSATGGEHGGSETEIGNESEVNSEHSSCESGDTEIEGSGEHRANGGRSGEHSGKSERRE